MVFFCQVCRSHALYVWHIGAISLIGFCLDGTMRLETGEGRARRYANTCYNRSINQINQINHINHIN